MLDSKKTYASVIFAAAVFFALSSRAAAGLSSPVLNLCRIISGFVTCFFSPGFLFSVAAFRKRGKAPETAFIILAGIFLSVLLTYPMAILNILIEGRENYYGYRLHRLSGLYLLVVGVAAFINMARGEKLVLKKYGSGAKLPALLTGILLVLSSFMVFRGIDAHDLCGDEINIGMRSYDLVDGNIARRKACFLSTVSHSPLINTAGFVSMQILQPRGFYDLQDWMFRFFPAAVSVMTVICLFFILYRECGILPAFAAALLLSVSNYHVWMGRILLREGLMVFMLSFAVFSAFRIKEDGLYLFFCALALGAAFLVKFTALFFAVPFFIYVYFRKKEGLINFTLVFFALCLPVILFNAAAYFTTGYMDQPFGKLFNMLGGDAGGPMVSHGDMYTRLVNPLDGIKNCLKVLADQSGIALSSLILTSVSFLAIRSLKERNRENLFILSAIAVSLVLFALNGVRAYYLYPVFFFMVAAVGMAMKGAAYKHAGYLFIILAAASLVNSVFIVINTQYKKFAAYKPVYDTGELAGHELPEINILKPVSFTTLLWVKSGNMKVIREYIKNNVNDDDLVLVDDNIYVLDYCWYIKEKALVLDDEGYLAYRKERHTDRIPGQPTIIWQSKYSLY
ncbi:MAG: glycosyltransferase family 39 protein, partial [Candidatus Aureabacteria bacterium]|nr:glycosyltransferase family 39 protein [Candidatus Auribacterota bacterium]